MPPRRSLKRSRSRSRSVKRKSSVRKKRKSKVKTSSSSSRSGEVNPPRRRSRAQSRARKSTTRRGSTRRTSTHRKRRKSTATPFKPSKHSKPSNVYTPPAPAPAPSRKSSVKKRRKRRMSTGAITTFYCFDCQADKNISNLSNLEYSHVAADTNKIKILAICRKCKGEVSRIVNPTQFEQLRKKKRINENLDNRPNLHPSLNSESQGGELYSFPSTPKTENLLSNDGDDGDSESGSESGSDNNEGVGVNNPQSDMVRSLLGDDVEDVDLDEGNDLKRMNKPPNLKEMGSSSYNFKCV